MEVLLGKSSINGSFSMAIRPRRQARTRALVALVATARLGASCLTSRLVSVLISVVLDRGAAGGAAGGPMGPQELGDDSPSAPWLNASHNSLDWFCWEHLNRKPWFLPSNWHRAFRLKFSHHPIL